jgi:hypothetical protein
LPGPDAPDTAAVAVTTGIRLDEALRGYLAEQGAKPLSKEDLWTLVVATMQLRLTATSLASLQALEPPRHHHQDMARAHATLVLPVSVPALAGLDGNSATVLTGEVDEANQGRLIQAIAVRHLPHLLWVEECLRHLSSHAQAITGPALLVAEQRRLPWWR